MSSPSTIYNPLDDWAKDWFGEADKCINEYICCGKDTKELRWKIAKVYSFWSALTTIRSRMQNEEDYNIDPNDPYQLESLYARLQCLIDLKID